MNTLFEFLDGKGYKLGECFGHFKYEFYTAKYPYERLVEKLIHEPADGVEYRRKKQLIGDDWVTDLTDAIDMYCYIAILFGYEYTGLYTNYQTELAYHQLLSNPLLKHLVGWDDFGWIVKYYVKSLVEKWLGNTSNRALTLDEPQGVVDQWKVFYNDDGFEVWDIYQTVDWDLLTKKLTEFYGENI